jgi:hypothetical protein
MWLGVAAAAVGCEIGAGEREGAALRKGEVEPEPEDDAVGEVDATSRFVFDEPAGDKTRSALGIDTWHIELAAAGADARVEGRDAAGMTVRRMEIRGVGELLEVRIDGALVEDEPTANAFAEVWQALANDTGAAQSNSESEAVAVSPACRASIRRLALEVANIALLSTTPGTVAVAIVAWQCSDCFYRNTNCDAQPLPYSDGTCYNARANTLGAFPTAARALRSVVRNCGCSNGLSDGEGFVEGDFAEFCTDAPCSEICVDASGEVPVDRGPYGEVCQCEDPDPCEGNPDPCCGSNDPCCGSGDPCCGSGDPCCGSNDPCCGSNDPCCGSWDECCGSNDPCCGSNDECCGNPDPCCGSGDPCCGVECPDDYYCDSGECVNVDVTILCESPDDCDGRPCVNGHCSGEH